MSDKVREALVEFCRDLEAVGIKELVEGEEWPDLLETYRKAKAALKEPIPDKDWVALAVFLDDERLCECGEGLCEDNREECESCREGRENRESDWDTYNGIVAEGLGLRRF